MISGKPHLGQAAKTAVSYHLLVVRFLTVFQQCRCGPLHRALRLSVPIHCSSFWDKFNASPKKAEIVEKKMAETCKIESCEKGTEKNCFWLKVPKI